MMGARAKVQTGAANVGKSRTRVLRNASERIEISVRSSATVDGRASTRTLAACHNQYRGQRAVILGNGPSLRETDLTLLQNEITFGLNRIYLLFDELGRETTFLVAINELLISQVADELASVRGQKFVGWSSRKLFDRSHGSVAFLQSRAEPGFSPDLRRGMWEGATVTYVALQLAFHMGFAKVVLVGVDHNFVTKGPAHDTVESLGPDPNHFHPGYFGQGFRWQLPDLESSERAYRLAKAAYAADDRVILDATIGGKLFVYPKCSLEAALTP